MPVHGSAAQDRQVDAGGAQLAHRAGCPWVGRAQHDVVDATGADCVVQSRYLRADGWIETLEGVLADDGAAFLRKGPLIAGADRLIVFDGFVDQHIAFAEALFVVAPLAHDRAFELGGIVGGEGERADAEDARLGVGGAEEDGDDAGLLSLQCGRRAVVVVRRHQQQICTVGDELLSGLGALDPVGLGIGGNDFDLRPSRPPLAFFCSTQSFAIFVESPS